MDKLPQELLRIIFNFFEPRSLDQVRSVCTSWFNIISKQSFTLYLIQNLDCNAIEKVFSRYTVPIELRFKKTLRIVDHHFAQSLARITSLTSLSITTDRAIQNAWLALTALTRLKQLKLEDPPIDLIEKLPQLNQLHLVRTYAFVDKVRAFTSLTALRDLKITFADQEDYTGLLPSIPNPSLLTKLVINGSVMNDFASIERFYNMKHLVLDYWSMTHQDQDVPLKFSALESLTINGTDVSIEDITMNTTLTHLTLGGVNCDSFNNFSRLSKLQTLELRTIYTPTESTDEDLAFLTNLTSLQYLDHSYVTGETTGKFSAYLSTNITKLIYSTDSLEGMQWTRLENLEELQISMRHPDENDSLLNLDKLSKLTRLELKVHSISAEIAKKINTGLLALNITTATTNVIMMDLTSMKNLKELSFSNTIVDPRCLEKLADLTALETFAANWYQSELMNISKMTQLTSLRLTHNETMEPQAMLSLLTNLQNLAVSSLSDDAIRNLTTLKNLTSLMCMKLQSEGFALTCLTSLQRIIAMPNLKNSQETSVSVRDKIVKALPHVISALF